jgi:taurine dioxygenase
MSSASVPARDADLVVRPVTSRVGAEVLGVQLSGSLPDATIEAINATLLRHKVIFFRDQIQLNDAEQERFSARLGNLVPHPTQQVRPGTASILELDSGTGSGRADAWHTDVTFVDAYPKISILRGVVIPEVGGDTVWSNTVAAYEGLPPALKALADQVWAVHSNVYDYATARPQASEEERRHYEEVFSSTLYETEHPVVRVHPETGERSLVLGSFVQRLVGFPGMIPSVCTPCCRVMCRRSRTPCGGAGGQGTWRSGTTAPRSTTRSTTTATAGGWCGAPPSTAISR